MKNLPIRTTPKAGQGSTQKQEHRAQHPTRNLGSFAHPPKAQKAQNPKMKETPAATIAPDMFDDNAHRGMVTVLPNKGNPMFDPGVDEIQGQTVQSRNNPKPRKSPAAKLKGKPAKGVMPFFGG